MPGFASYNLHGCAQSLIGNVSGIAYELRSITDVMRTVEQAIIDYAVAFGSILRTLRHLVNLASCAGVNLYVSVFGIDIGRHVQTDSGAIVLVAEANGLVVVKPEDEVVIGVYLKQSELVIDGCDGFDQAVPLYCLCREQSGC